MDRHNRRVKLKELQLEMIHAEANDKTIEVSPTYIQLPPEVDEFEKQIAQKKVIELSTPAYFNDQFDIFLFVKEKRTRGVADEYELRWLKEYEDFQENPKTPGWKRGLLQDDPYLAKHWGELNRSAGI